MTGVQTCALPIWIEAGTAEVNPEIFDPAVVLSEVLELLRPLAESRGLALYSTVEANAGSLSTDRGKTKQILLNLVGNALKFTQSGEVHVGLSVSDGTATYRVNDTGPGLPPEALARIFEPFVQYEHTGDLAKPEGTGLGLAISAQFARMLGGEIAVESVVGQGSTFTLTLPVGGVCDE